MHMRVRMASIVFVLFAARLRMLEQAKDAEGGWSRLRMLKEAGAG